MDSQMIYNWLLLQTKKRRKKTKTTIVYFGYDELGIDMFEELRIGKGKKNEVDEVINNIFI